MLNHITQGLGQVMMSIAEEDDQFLRELTLEEVLVLLLVYLGTIASVDLLPQAQARKLIYVTLTIQ